MADHPHSLTPIAITERGGSPLSAEAFRATSFISGAYVLAGLALLPFAREAGPELPGFNAVFAAGVFVTELATAFLLIVLFRREPRLSTLLLVAAFSYSTVMSVGYLLAYPAAVAQHRSIIGTPQSIAWIYNSWVVGFAVVTFAAAAIETFRIRPSISKEAAERSALAVPIVAALTAVGVIAGAATLGHRMPLLAAGGVWTPLNTFLNITAAVLLATSGCLILAVMRPPRALFLWLSLALAAIAVGNALSVIGGARYSIGWYACRLSWLASSCILLLYFLSQFLHQQGQLMRVTDDLEERTRERDRIWNVSEDLLGVSTFEGYFINLNPAWQKVLGWSDSEVEAMHVDVLRHPDDAAHSRQGRARLAEGIPTVRMENRFRHKDGTWRWISWTMTVDQGLIYVAGRHITAEKNAEEALRKAEADAAHRQKMEALGQLTGGVAHDFNNLLMIVSGYIPRLKAAIGKDPKANEAAEAIETASRRGAALTRQLLSFSRRQPISPQVIDVGACVASMGPMLVNTLGPWVKLQIEVVPDLWPVRVDGSEFELALLNLVLNARDAMKQDGAVTISAENRRVVADEAPDGLAGSYVQVTVRDNGRGIAPEMLSRVFDPFFTTKPVGKGTGLGLSQVHGFSRQSGGTVRIESTPEAGTAVSLLLPRAQGPSTASDEAAELPMTTGGKALLVEDNATVAAVSREMLEHLGYDVRVAPGPQQGLALLDAEEFDLVVSDIVMPGDMDGIDLARTIRRGRPKMPILLVSGYSASLTGASQEFTVLPKPFRLEQLAHAIARISA